MEAEKKESFFKETLRFALLTLIIVLPIRFFVAEPFIVSGVSMDPTYKNGDYLIVDRLTYHFEKPKRGEVIIFRPPLNERRYYIKRIIGLPGDTISIHEGKVTIVNETHKDGFLVPDAYIVHTMPQEFKAGPLKSGEYFVLGDNRRQSSDSRIWGVVPEKNITGRSLLRLFPFGTLGAFPGSHTAESVN